MKKEIKQYKNDTNYGLSSSKSSFCNYSIHENTTKCNYIVGIMTTYDKEYEYLYINGNFPYTYKSTDSVEYTTIQL